MQMRFVVTTVLLTCLLWPQSSQSAEVMRSTYPVRLAGQYCHDVRGAEVSILRFDGLRDVAHAVIMNRLPYIVLNPTRLATLPPKLQAFFYEHECAHHLLGHNYNPTLDSEAEADCLAIKVGREKGLFTRVDVHGFRHWIEPLLGSARGHLPGRERQRLLMQCFDDNEPSRHMAERMRTALGDAVRFRKASRRSAEGKSRR